MSDELTKISRLERLSKEWLSPIYAFFEPMPSIVVVDGRRVHEFRCTAGFCKGRGKNSRIVRRYLDTSDRNSTGNLRKHARICWGDEVLQGAQACANLDSAREGLRNAKKQRDGSLTAAFEWKGKGKLTFSHRPHTKAETRFVTIHHGLMTYLTIAIRAELVRWVSENMRPFSIVSDRAFQSLMKTGRPSYYIPAACTVSRDVKHAFMKVRGRIAKMLQVRSRVSYMIAKQKEAIDILCKYPGT